jgi:hypothetical protein
MTQPRILAVGEEPPPMDDSGPRRNGAGPRRDSAKGKSGSGRRRTGDRFGLLNAFVDFTMANLKPSERAAWLVLFRDTKSNGIARTSESDIARRAGCCVRMVRYALASLARRGLLRIVRRGGLQSGPSSYRVFGLAEPRP